jgi:hypothetical protein
LNLIDETEPSREYIWVRIMGVKSHSNNISVSYIVELNFIGGGNREKSQLCW